MESIGIQNNFKKSCLLPVQTDASPGTGVQLPSVPLVSITAAAGGTKYESCSYQSSLCTLPDCPQ